MGNGGDVLKFFEEFEFEEEIPKYVQIAESVEFLIDKNRIKDGEKLPTIRELSAVLSVNNVTIVNAYNKLKTEGYAYQKIGSGSYAKRKEITSGLRKEYAKSLKKISTNENKNIIDFTGETSAEIIFPVEDIKSILNEVLDRDGAYAFVSDNRAGYPKLIKTINDAFWRGRLNENNIIVVSGAQQGIDIVSKILLNINDNVIVESPTYVGALSVFKWRKVNLFSAPMKKDGIDLKKFEKILQKNKIKCFFTMSYFQNPTGASYSLKKKKRILDLAEIYDFYIIEDDYLSELIYNSSMQYTTFKELDTRNRVIYIKSFSKIFFPGIRLGYVAVPNNLSEVFKNSKHNTDIATSSLMQRALDLYISKGVWKNNLKELYNEYSLRYNIVKDILNKDFKELLDYIDPKGGLTFYVTLKDKKKDTNSLFLKLRSRGVYITPANLFYSSKEEGRDSFRISIYQTNEEKIKKGMKILKDAILEL